MHYAVRTSAYVMQWLRCSCDRSRVIVLEWVYKLQPQQAVTLPYSSVEGAAYGSGSVR